jgi:hypothetical protein
MCFGGYGFMAAHDTFPLITRANSVACRKAERCAPAASSMTLSLGYSPCNVCPVGAAALMIASSGVMTQEGCRFAM